MDVLGSGEFLTLGSTVLRVQSTPTQPWRPFPRKLPLQTGSSTIFTAMVRSFCRWASTSFTPLAVPVPIQRPRATRLSLFLPRTATSSFLTLGLFAMWMKNTLRKRSVSGMIWKLTPTMTRSGKNETCYPISRILTLPCLPLADGTIPKIFMVL